MRVYIYTNTFINAYTHITYLYMPSADVQLSLSVSQDSKRLVGHYARSMASWARHWCSEQFSRLRKKKRLQRSTILTW